MVSQEVVKLNPNINIPEKRIEFLGKILEGALLIANRILEKVRSCEIAGKNVSVTIAAGEINTAKSEEINERLNEIDEGLLKAKMTGKNKVVSVDLNV